MHIITFRDKDRLEQIQQENLAKLTALNQKRTDLEATIKTHSHEKEVFEDASAKYQQQFEAIQAQRDKISNDKRKYSSFTPFNCIESILDGKIFRFCLVP